MLATLTFLLAAAPSAVGVDVAGGLGVNIQFLTPPAGTIEKIRLAGFRWVRFDLNWEQVEKKQGTYDFSRYDRLVHALDAAGLRMLAILDYGNPIYGAGPLDTPVERRAFASFAAAAAKRYANQAVAWEVWNEPNTAKFWGGKPNADDYTALLTATARAIRQESPKSQIIGPSVSGFDWSFLSGCFKAGLLESVNAVSVHPYRASAPETAYSDYKRLQSLIAKYVPRDKSIPVWCSEVGYTRTSGVTENLQAAYAVRERLTAAAAGVPVTIHYRWSDPPGYGEEPIGLISGLGEQTPTLGVLKRFSALTRGYRVTDFIQISKQGGMLAKLTSTSGDTQVLAWSARNEKLSIRLHRPTAVKSLTSSSTKTVSDSLSIGPFPVAISSASVLGLLESRSSTEAHQRHSSYGNGSFVPQVALGSWGPQGLMVLVKAWPDQGFAGTLRATSNGQRTSQPIQLSVNSQATVVLRGLGKVSSGDSVVLDWMLGRNVLASTRYRPIWAGVDGPARFQPAVRPKSRGVDLTVNMTKSLPNPVLGISLMETATPWDFFTLNAQPAPSATTGEVLQIVVKSDEVPAYVRCRFVDAKGRTFQPAGERILPGEFQVVRIDLTDAGTPRWGGTPEGTNDPLTGTLSIVSPVLIDVGKEGTTSRSFQVAGVWIEG